MKTLHIFKPGRHAPMGGGSLNFSEADLIATARAYDPDLHEAPLVIGHPSDNGPAYGWVGALRVDGTGLRAVPRQVDPSFAEVVRTGQYKKLSASFYSPDSPHNPKPGVYYLRHVGFLGAQPPAVKGLDPINLGEPEIGVLCFAEGDGESPGGTALFKKLRQWLVDNKGQDVADDLLPEDKVRKLTESAPAPEAADPAEVEPGLPAEELVEELVQEVAAQAETIEQLNEEIEEMEERQVDKEVAGDAASFVEGLVRSGRIRPRHRAAVVAFMEVAAGRGRRRKAGGVLSFGEGSSARPLLPAFRSFLSSLPPSVEFDELATKNRAGRRSGVNPLVADAQRRAKASR